MGEEKDFIKKGTTTVGIVCKDGIVLAVDKRATSGNLIVKKDIDKIHIVLENIAITMAGTVSDAQLLTKLLKAQLNLNKIRIGKGPTVREAANLLAGMVYSNIRKMSLIPGISHFLMGGQDSSGYYLYDVGADGSVLRCDDYASSGSGSVMAYGVLETLYQKGLTVDEGIKLAVKAINSAIQRDTYTGDGLDVVVIRDGIKNILTKQLNKKISD